MLYWLGPVTMLARGLGQHPWTGTFTLTSCAKARSLRCQLHSWHTRQLGNLAHTSPLNAGRGNATGGALRGVSESTAASAAATHPLEEANKLDPDSSLYPNSSQGSMPASKQEPGHGQVAMDITRHNLATMLPAVQKALQECTFYAFDCEMSGLTQDNYKEDYLDDYQDRYAKMSSNAQAFIITQFGLSCFKAVPSGSSSTAGPRSSNALANGGGISSSASTAPTQYSVSTFNFYIFPEPSGDGYSRKFVCDAGSLSFLAGNGFDFNKCIYEGIPYMPARIWERQKQQALRSDGGSTREPVVATRADDVAFLADMVTKVTEWMGRAEEPTLQLPVGNSFMRLLCYQELAKPQFGVQDTPGFIVQKVDSGGWGTSLLLTKASPEGIKEAAEKERVEKAALLDAAAGFTRVFTMMRDCGAPAVGHNCMYDILFTLASFAESPLPDQWSSFKYLTSRWFKGGLYDTKVLSKNLPEVFKQETSLGQVFAAMTQEGPAREAAQHLLREAGSAHSLPDISHAPGFEKYNEVAAGGLAHEAGYDAFMTGAAFASILPILQAQQALALKNAPPPAQTTTQPDTSLAAPSDSGILTKLISALSTGTTAATPTGPTTATTAATAAAGAAASTSQRPPAPASSSAAAATAPATAAAPAAATAEELLQLPPLEAARPFLNRMNIMRSDITHFDLTPGADPPLVRPNVYFVTGFPQGVREGDLVRRIAGALGDVGGVRLRMLPGYSSAFAELEPRVVGNLAGLAAAAPELTLQPFAEHADAKRAALAAGLTPYQVYNGGQGADGGGNGQRGQKRSRPGADDSQPVTAAAAAAADSSKPAAVEASRPSCAIM